MANEKRPAAGKKLNRAEKSAQTRQRLITAAAKVIGKWGYAEASVARITAQARLAHGTFYSYFKEREEIFEFVLPAIGNEMLAFISERQDPELSPVENDVARIQGFFDFLTKVPEFLRIYNEAEFFAPVAYRKHIANVHSLYLSSLKRAQKNVAVKYTDEELDFLVDILLAARRKLMSRCVGRKGKPQPLPEAAVSAYRKLISEGLFSPATEAESEAPAPKAKRAVRAPVSRAKSPPKPRVRKAKVSEVS